MNTLGRGQFGKETPTSCNVPWYTRVIDVGVHMLNPVCAEFIYVSVRKMFMKSSVSVDIVIQTPRKTPLPTKYLGSY